MRSAALLSLLFLASACPAPGTPAPTPAPTPVATETPPETPNAIATLNGFADRVCACQDEPCRKAIDDELTQYGEANKAELEALDPASIQSIGQRYESCRMVGGGNGGDLIAEFGALTDEMCACKDKACAEATNARFDAWMNANADAKGSDDQKEKAKKIADRYTQCLMTAMAGIELPGMGAKCGANDACAAGLECVKYYGIAGKRGGEFTSCEKKCGKGRGTCGDGEKCTVIADGPGQVCRKK